MLARRYEFYVLVTRTISHEWTQRTSEILFLPLELKIHIFLPPCNILYILAYENIDVLNFHKTGLKIWYFCVISTILKPPFCLFFIKLTTSRATSCLPDISNCALKNDASWKKNENNFGNLTGIYLGKRSNSFKLLSNLCSSLGPIKHDRNGEKMPFMVSFNDVRTVFHACLLLIGPLHFKR